MKKCIICALTLMLCLTACGQTQDTPVTETAAPSTLTLTEPTEEPTVEPTTEPETEPTEPPVLFHSGLRSDGSFDEGTWFFGDSMTCILVSDYLKPTGLIGQAKYTGKYGSQITAFFDGTKMNTSSNRCEYNPEFQDMEYNQVAQLLGEDATAIYFMWGTNFTWNAYADAYIELVEYLLETCPNATVHMQKIPWAGNNELVRYEQVNIWIQEAYDHFQEIGEERVFLIDTYTAIGKNTDSGYIHLNETGNENWYNAIVAHAKENNLSQ